MQNQRIVVKMANPSLQRTTCPLLLSFSFGRKEKRLHRE